MPVYALELSGAVLIPHDERAVVAPTEAYALEDGYVKSFSDRDIYVGKLDVKAKLFDQLQLQPDSLDQKVLLVTALRCVESEESLIS